MAGVGQKFKNFVRRVPNAPAFRAFRYRDFRLLWTGAFISFTGVQVQGIAQGYLVYKMTGDLAMLALIMFATMVPVSFFGPVLGVFADILDRRKVMVISMIILSLGSLFLGFAVTFNFIEYWHLIAIALVNGFVMTIETPARQSIVREVVPEKELVAAVPTMAMTFNLARVAGPAIGAILISQVGEGICFWVNALSFAGLIFATLAIRADLSPKLREPQPMRDLLTEGMLYVMKHKSLRVLFFMEATTSFFGIFYIALMPAIAKDMLGLGAVGLGKAMSSIGIGAFCGLILLVSISHKPFKPLMGRIAMTTFAITMITLAYVKEPLLAYPLFALLGASTMIQFNTTNTLFQLISPDRLRGRVLSMHMWAITGFAPLGILLFGYVSQQSSLSTVFLIGGSAIGCGAALGWVFRGLVKEPELSAA